MVNKDHKPAKRPLFFHYSLAFLTGHHLGKNTNLT